MRPIVFQSTSVGAIASRPAGKLVSPGTLGAIGLASGVIGLVGGQLGFGSWIMPATAFVVWCMAGWRLFFANAGNNRIVRALGYVFLSTGLVVAAAIVLKLYLAALGSAWKL